MYNAGMWLVVKPTVGIPLFLGAVAVGSFAVHVAVLTNTTWLPQFLNGETMTSGAAAEASAPVEGSSAVVLFEEGERGAAVAGKSAVVVLPDGRTATVTFEAPPVAAPPAAVAAEPEALALAREPAD